MNIEFKDLFTSAKLNSAIGLLRQRTMSRRSSVGRVSNEAIAQMAIVVGVKEVVLPKTFLFGEVHR